MTAALGSGLVQGIAPVHAASYDHTLHCMAGFFASETQARAAVQQLRQVHGLRPDQGLLLGPDKASWLSFGRQAWTWTHGGHTGALSGLSDAPVMAALGGFAVAMCIVLGIALHGLPDTLPAALLLLLGPVAGAATGGMVAALTDSRAQQRRFNRHVRGQLAAGGWVVLAHHILTHQQSGAAEILREHGDEWCAVYAPWRLL